MATSAINSNKISPWELRTALLQIHQQFFPDAMYFDEPLFNYNLFEMDTFSTMSHIGIRRKITFQERRYYFCGKLVTRYMYEDVIVVFIDNSIPNDYIVSIRRIENKETEMKIREMLFLTP